MSEVNDRLAALEKEVRRCSNSAQRDRAVTIGISAVLVFLVMGGTGQSDQVSEEIRTKRLLIVDEKGATRAGVVMAKDGSAGLIVLDDRDKVRASFLVFADGGAGLNMNDKGGVSRASIGVSPQGMSSIVLCHESGEPRVMLKEDAEVSALFLYDKKALIGAALAVGTDGSRLLKFNGKTDTPRAAFAVDSEGLNWLKFFGGKGEERMRIGLTANDAPFMRMLDRQGADVWKAPPR